MKPQPQHNDDRSRESNALPPSPPPARLLRLPEVIDRVGLRRSAIYQRMSEGRFPKSRSLGPKCAVWVEAEIDQWISEIAKGGS
ncbi:AlpA family transcriptional regulator [Qipengyuania pacifica]|mgnify:FL=1|uniref:AlpA family transcriptional regulator n=1 Tax=Qipengyuania pacifica TaxID=2860199 RepID=UPI001C9E1A2F|nr:AlpA family transcriptional regulator [Qipengyuania pacifica]MBY8335037.1 AlpA family transcriptional regulator [Qipengyuania pacifica]